MGIARVGITPHERPRRDLRSWPVSSLHRSEGQLMATPDKLTPLQELEARRTAGKDKPTRAISEAEKAVRRDRVVRAKDALARSVGAKGDHVARARAALKTYLQHLNDTKQPDDARFDELVEAPFKAPPKKTNERRFSSTPVTR